MLLSHRTCVSGSTRSICCSLFGQPIYTKIPVRVANTPKFPVKLKKNHLLGELHPVLVCSEIPNSCGDPLTPSMERQKCNKSCELEVDGDSEDPCIPTDWNDTADVVVGFCGTRPMFPSYLSICRSCMTKVVQRYKAVEIKSNWRRYW